MASFLYPSYLHDAAVGLIDTTSDNHRCMLLTNAYTPSKLHDRRDDLTSFEVAGTGYSAGGIVQTVTSAFTGGEFVLTMGAVTFTTVTLSGVRYAATYRLSGSGAASDSLIFLLDLLTDRADLSGSFPIAASIYRSTGGNG